MEIRTSVTDYVTERIGALRIQNQDKGLYQNVSVLRANSMKFMPNFFFKYQVGLHIFRANINWLRRC